MSSIRELTSTEIDAVSGAGLTLSATGLGGLLAGGAADLEGIFSSLTGDLAALSAGGSAIFGGLLGNLLSPLSGLLGGLGGLGGLGL